MVTRKMCVCEKERCASRLLFIVGISTTDGISNGVSTLVQLAEDEEHNRKCAATTTTTTTTATHKNE